MLALVDDGKIQIESTHVRLFNHRFQFRTYEQNGLIMFNAGKASDFIAIELNNGKLYYTLNLGYGPISIKDTAPGTLSDNKWHKVTIGRPSRYRHTLMVDGHFAMASTRGDNYHLDLDGILFLGAGVESFEL
jgi:neurexin